MQIKILEERLFNLSERMKSAKNIKHSGVRAMKVKQIKKEVAAARRQLNKLKEVSSVCNECPLKLVKSY